MEGVVIVVVIVVVERSSSSGSGVAMMIRGYTIQYTQIFGNKMKKDGTALRATVVPWRRQAKLPQEFQVSFIALHVKWW